MTEPHYRTAPAGFTTERWAEFEDRGLIKIENALTPDEIQRYLDAIERVASADPRHEVGGSLRVEYAVERDPVFAELIDHPRHVGYMYDIFGEMLKLLRFDVRIRARSGENNAWHPDSPRATPYQVYSPRLPLRASVGYWLTDVPTPKMGNFVYMPGSHREQYFDAYQKNDSVAGEEVLCVKAGTLTVYNGNLWHRVEANDTDIARKNVFVSYCPSWVTAGDHASSDPAWLATLTREQRIIMRSYPVQHAYENPDAEDFPLFLDRETGRDSDLGVADHIPLRIRKRKTWAEQQIQRR